VILREAESVHRSGARPRRSRSGAWACEPVGHGVDATAPPACAEAAATRGTTGLLLWTLAFSILRPGPGAELSPGARTASSGHRPTRGSTTDALDSQVMVSTDQRLCGGHATDSSRYTPI
jgi:hypothetical protein